MNIFYLHKDPVVCAPLHCDKHVVKMIIEYAQMLSTAHRMLDGKEYIDASSGRRIRRWRHPNSNMDGVLYKASHINHPSAIWVRASVNNYQWTLRLWQQLCFEYTYRYGKIHLTYDKLKDIVNEVPQNIPTDIPFSEPPPAMPDYCKFAGNSLISYHKYYAKEKKRFAKWTLRETPTFMEQYA